MKDDDALGQLEPLVLPAKITYRMAIFATIPLFMSYAGMVSLQRSIEERIGLENLNTYIFGIAIGNLYLGNLIFRLMHNFLFSYFVPRERVMISYAFSSVAHLTIALAYWVFNSKSLVWVFVAYLFAGVSVGTFESNFLSCIKPLGDETKSWAILGIPIGFNGVSIGFYILFWLFPSYPALHVFPYFLISGVNILGAWFFYYYIPYVEFEASYDNIKLFVEYIKDFKECDASSPRSWICSIWINSLALMIDMFCVSMFSSIVYYLYETEELGLVNGKQISRNAFQVWYNTFAFLGDFISRKLAYSSSCRPNVLIFLVLSVIGGFVVLSRITIIAPFGIFLVMFANGSIYNHTTKHIDTLEPKYNLFLLSIWLFVGDFGSYSSSLLIQPFQEWLKATNTTL